MRRQFFHILRRFDRKVVAHADAINIFLMPFNARARRYKLMSGEWLVFRLGQIPGYTHDGRRHADSMAGLLQRSRYILAVGPPKSEMTPVNPLTVSRMVSIRERWSLPNGFE